MDNDSFYNTVRSHLAESNVDDIVTQIPNGSGIFHIANVPPDRFDAAWISQNAGRFSEAGEKIRYYANQFDVCARELGYPPGTDPLDVVFVAAELNQPTKVIDVHKLPAQIQTELYSDKVPETKWDKSYLFMKAVRENECLREIRGIYFPSASGQMLETGGSCLALFDPPILTNVIGSGGRDWWKSQYQGNDNEHVT